MRLFNIFIFITGVFYLNISNLYSQVALPGYAPPGSMPELIPFREGFKWGYSDINGKIIIPPKYDNTNFFVGKIAVAEYNDSNSIKKFGLINIDGDTTWKYGFKTPNIPDGDTTWSFNSSMRKIALITPTGNVFTEFENTSLYTITDTSVLVMTYDYNDYKNKYYIIDIHKNITKLYQYKDVYYISNYGIAQTDSNCYLLDGKGVIIKEINCESVNNRLYDSIIPIEKLYEFKNGFAHFGYGENNFIDKKGNKYLCTKPTYLQSSSSWNKSPNPVKSGVAIMEKEGQSGLLDSLGSIIVPFGKYDKIDEFSDGMAKVYINEELTGFINTKGEELILSPKVKNPDDFHCGFAKVETGKDFEEYGFINKKGKILKLKKRYDEIGTFSEGFCLINFADQYGFIDTTGKEVIPATLEFEFVDNFSDGLCKVKKDSLYGFIDKKGIAIIPPSFADITSFYNGVAQLDYTNATAYYNGSDSFKYRLYLINKSGEKLPYYFEEDEEWFNGYHIINYTENGLKGLIDRNNNIVVNCQYEYIDIYPNGLARCSFDTQTSYINLKTGVKYFNE